MLEFDEEVKWILGRPNFWCRPYAVALRLLGREILARSEDEQAAVIYWMLSLYEKYGSEWRGKVAEALEAAANLQSEPIAEA